MNTTKHMDRDTVLPTGLPSLDEMLGGGLHAGSLNVIASRPAMGKKSFALQIAGNLGAAGNHVMIFSLELQKEYILQRFKKTFGNAPSWDTLCIDDDIFVDVGSILEKVSFLEQCDVVLIDDLQSLVGDTNRRAIIDCIRTLKALARLASIPVIVTSHLPFARIEQRKDHRPILSDLVIPALYADVVIFPFREAYYYSDEDSELNEKAELIVAGNRYGTTGVLPCHWNLEKRVFEELPK